MKRSTQGGLAHQLEGLMAEDFKGYANRKLYVLDGQPGIYRRLTAAVAKEREKDTAAAQPIKGVYDGKVLHLERQRSMEAELHEAGYSSRHLPIDGLAAKTFPLLAEAGDLSAFPSEEQGADLPELPELDGPATVPESVAVGADGPSFVPPPDDNGL